jgi:hypothetical protein
MRHDRLIDQLTGDLKPVRRRRLSVDIAVIAAICAAELLVFFAMKAQRPDMPLQMHQMSFWWRLASLGLIAGISGSVAIASFNPVYAPRRAVRWLLLEVHQCRAVCADAVAGPPELACRPAMHLQDGSAVDPGGYRPDRADAPRRADGYQAHGIAVRSGGRCLGGIRVCVRLPFE